MKISKPYLLFLGDAADRLAAKTAQGVKDWREGDCVGQLRMEGCNADTGLDDVTIEEACKAGAKTLVAGVANRGGIVSQAWIAVLLEALEAGLDIAAGLHNRVADIPELKEAADRLGRSIFDVRHPSGTYPVASGEKRTGKRLLPVGTDCSCGKMYTALAIEREMKKQGMKATFRATGQTGILIAGEGVSVDAVVADFISGTVEVIAPANDPDHWDIIEGQGSLFHASYAGVSTGLLHGAQPDVLILCHEPTRTHMRGLPHFPLPELEECMEANLKVASLTNPDVCFSGVAIDTSRLDEDKALEFLAETGTRLGLPAVDPVRTGVAAIITELA
jgi:uncharacterized NAD-dependent epimerase/dehydratase family protein